MRDLTKSLCPERTPDEQEYEEGRGGGVHPVNPVGHLNNFDDDFIAHISCVMCPRAVFPAPSQGGRVRAVYDGRYASGVVS